MPTVLLDISRSVSRIGKGRHTGIDRVEAAYIDHFLNATAPAFFLARFRKQSAILDRAGMEAFQKSIQQSKTSKPRLVGKALRKHAVSWSLIGHDLGKNLPSGFTYINVGHGRFRPELWQKLRKAGAGKIVAMVHDVIPLDFPHFCKPLTTETFHKNLKALAAHADILLYNSTDTKARTQVWLKNWGHTGIESHVLLLGTDPLVNTSTIKQDQSYFICLGTIEPRKNHALLLNIWADFHKALPLGETPHLHIVGARGWMNEDVFHTLDSADYMNKTVFERGQLSDTELGALLNGAQALLFPSFAEGFGYPLVEALQMNVPVICSDLPSFHETANDAPTYLSPDDQPAWREAILEHSISSRKIGEDSKISQIFPSWTQHFHSLDTIITDKLFGS